MKDSRADSSNRKRLLPSTPANGTPTTNVTIDADDVLGYARNESAVAVSSISYTLLLFPRDLRSFRPAGMAACCAFSSRLSQ
jgi:hypothetical protein